uniref:Uncharacterized protein n=1 Tax=Noccaea caerulescens TaxID=107243 RepID=A0A1J3EYN8_NOCCA
MEACNKFAAMFERYVKNSAYQSGMVDATTTIKELSSALKASQEREESYQLELDAASRRVNKISLLEGQLAQAHADARSADERIRQLQEANKSFAHSRERAIRDASRISYHRTVSKYKKLLTGVQECWSKKDKSVTAEIALMEASANLELIKDVMAGNSTLENELPKWEQKHKEFENVFDAIEFSDFSLGKLDMPQLSEDSVFMEVDRMTQVPAGIDQFGSNVGAITTDAGTNVAEAEAEIPSADRDQEMRPAEEMEPKE